MSGIRARDREVTTNPLWSSWQSHPTLAQLIRDRSDLLTLADQLAEECEDAREWFASRAAAPEVQARIEAVIAKWKAAAS